MSKTLVIEYSNSTPEQRVQIPDDAVVTFGGLIPGAKVDGGSNRTALRIYGAKKVQLAVFTGVSNFRFLDQITVLEKRTQQAAKIVVVEENGVQKSRNVTVTSEDWINPDIIQESNENIAARLQLKNEV